MASVPKVLAFAGSLRRESYNKRLVRIAASAAEAAGAEVTLIDLKHYPMPIFDEDLEAASGPTEAVLAVRAT
jgi:NAD(P)H-dependent FMN reductase